MIYIHLGYPKAGSSTLQANLFANEDLFFNCSAKSSKNPKYLNDKIDHLNELILHKDGVILNDNDIINTYNEIIQYNTNNRKVIYSSEFILSTRFSNKEISEKIRRVQLLGKEAKLLVIIRNQVDLLKSLYRDHPYDPRSIDYRLRSVSFSEFLRIDLSQRYHSHTSSLFYSKLYDTICRWYEKKQINFIPLEMIQTNCHNFYARLSDSIDVDQSLLATVLKNQKQNEGNSNILTSYKRFSAHLRAVFRGNALEYRLQKLNKIIENKLRYLGKKDSIKVHEDEVNRIKRYYTEDNKKLSNIIDISLDNMNYYSKGYLPE